MTEPAARAVQILRDPATFQWFVIPLFAFVVHVYATEIERKNWNGVLAGATFFLMDVLWEVLNALILHFSGHSSLWVVSGGSAYVILVGWSIEIALMFSIAGVVFSKMLPADRSLRILGLPNRVFYILVTSLFCAGVECLLVQTPHFHWGYPWWNFPLVALIGYAPFDTAAFLVYDAPRRAQIRAVIGLLAVDAAMIAVFGVLLRWI